MKVRGQIIRGYKVPNDPVKHEKWLTKYEGYFYEADYKIPGKNKCPKTAKQLGYIWVTLIPEIHKQFVADGQTQTLNVGGIHREIPITKDACYEWLNELCGRVGENGKLIRLSDPDMDIGAANKYIEGLLDVAMNLGMDLDKLKARRPK